MSELAEVQHSDGPTGQLPVGDLVDRLLGLARIELGRDLAWDGVDRRILVDGTAPLPAPEARFVEMLGAALGELADVEGAAMDRQRRIRDRVGRVIRDDALSTVFQPILDLASGRVVGAEALSRFPAEPRRPDLWFADAQSVGLGTALELCAIVAALRHLDDLPPDVYLGLNASPRLLCTAELYDAVSRFPADRIVLELTEHAVVADYDELTAALDRLRGLGLRLAVDDLGAGFASFSHVLRIRPDILKIDISITRSIDQDPARRGLARGIVALAREMGATVVAEGVETQAELDCLAPLGIDAAQGYLVARPSFLPLAEPRAVPVHPDAPASAAVVDAPTVDVARDAHGLAEVRFELALLHSPIGIALVGLDGRFLHVNPALTRMFGYGEDELLSTSFQELTHADDLEVDLHLLAECLDGGRDDYDLVKRYRCGDGSYLSCNLTVVLVRGEGDAPLYFISQIQPRSPGDP